MSEPLTIVSMPPRPHRKPQVKRKPRKATKLSKVGLKRLWGVPDNAWMRYSGIKGIFWWHFSRFIRKRDVKKWGKCISCGREITVETSDCGHFVPASQCGRDLLFDELNNNAECSYCNAWDGLHLVGYAKGLDARYGVGTADTLIARYKAYKNSKEIIKDWKRPEYEAKIKAIMICG